jgi:RNA polymerase sigma-70 factor (ECF subfamily)
LHGPAPASQAVQPEHARFDHRQREDDHVATGQQEPALARTTTSTHLLEGLRDPADRSVWQLFANRYRPLLVSYARRSFGLSDEDAEDATQVTLADFAEAYRKGQYDRDKGRLRKWLFGIATNRMRDLARRNARKREFQANGSSDSAGFLPAIPADDELETAWEAEWRHAVIRQCLDEVRFQFDPKTVEAFELYVWKGRPAREVAARLSMTENAVYLARHHVLKRIRELLPRMEEIW